MVSSLNGDANTLPMEQYFMQRISKCYDKSGSQIFRFRKIWSLQKIILWNMMMQYVSFLSHSFKPCHIYANILVAFVCVFEQTYCDCSFWIIRYTISFLLASPFFHVTRHEQKLCVVTCVDESTDKKQNSYCLISK